MTILAPLNSISRSTDVWEYRNGKALASHFSMRRVNTRMLRFSRTSRAASCRLEHFLAQERESTSSIHGALHRLQRVHFSFNRAVTPGQNSTRDFLTAWTDGLCRLASCIHDHLLPGGNDLYHKKAGQSKGKGRQAEAPHDGLGVLLFLRTRPAKVEHRKCGRTIESCNLQDREGRQEKDVSKSTLPEYLSTRSVEEELAGRIGWYAGIRCLRM
jgi:hypothetical protein